MTLNKAELAVELYEKKIVRFGEFKLRSGETSNIYFDLRQTITYPNIISSLAHQYLNLYYQHHLAPPVNKLHVCGIAYTGIPIATAISQISELPMIMKRKEAKDYGTKQLIEGHYNRGDHVILIDDVITSGGSIIETIADLESVGLIVTCVLVLIDRRPVVGGRPPILNDKYPLFSVYRMEDMIRSIKKHVRGQTVLPPGLVTRTHTFEQRSLMTGNAVGRELLRIMHNKKTNLVLSADVTTMAELLRLADLVGPEICMIKTHMDMIADFNYENVIPQLRKLSEKHNFVILEDRKFADIGNTVVHQYTGGIHRIFEWAHLVTVHSLLGEGIVSTFSQICKDSHNRGILLIAQLSNAGNQITPDYTLRCRRMAEKHSNIVAGLICSEKLSNNLGLIHCTPGVNLHTDSDKLDQQYHTPQWVIGDLESDLVIVGRGIYESPNPVESAKKYRTAAWNAYESNIPK